MNVFNNCVHEWMKIEIESVRMKVNESEQKGMKVNGSERK